METAKIKRKNSKKSTATQRRKKLKKKNAIHPDHNRKIEVVLDAMRERLQDCLGIPFELDHILPISKGGPHHHGNLQVIPKELNRLKSSCLDFVHPLLTHWTELPEFLTSWVPKIKATNLIKEEINNCSRARVYIGQISGSINCISFISLDITLIIQDSELIQKKECSFCCKIKRVDEFRTDLKNLNGLNSWCFECEKAYKLRSYKINRVAYNKKTREWQKEDKAKKAKARTELREIKKSLPPPPKPEKGFLRCPTCRENKPLIDFRIPDLEKARYSKKCFNCIQTIEKNK